MLSSFFTRYILKQQPIVISVAWNGNIQDWEQDQWDGIETVLQPALGAVVEVEDDGSSEIDYQRQEEEVAHEALLLVDIPSPLLRQPTDILQ